MDFTDHTILSGFERQEEWGDFTTLQQRRFYLRRLIRHMTDHKIRASSYYPGGYDVHTSNLFEVNNDGLQDLDDFQLKVLDPVCDLPDLIRFNSPEWGLLQQYMNRMSREYKIHLQPREEYIPDVVCRLAELILGDEFLQQNIICFKCRVIFRKDNPEFNRAIIILYLALQDKRLVARQMCRQVLNVLKPGLAEYENCANGYLPIYNYPVTDLISFIQIGTDTKFRLRKILGKKRFNQLFPVEFYQALLMDEDPGFYLA